VRTTRLGSRHYSEGVDERDDPRGRAYYWIGGPGGPRHDAVEGSDTEAVDAGFVSVTPLRLDVTFPDHLGFAAKVAAPDPDDEA
jgi:5'-nucleotidase